MEQPKQLRLTRFYRTASWPRAAYMGCWLVFATTTSYASLCRADTVTAVGTVEAVDAEAGTITVRRKTANGEKTATLKVGGSAHIQGPKVDAVEMSSLAKGDTVELVYDTTLKEITKITVQSDEPQTDDSSRDAGCTFFILRISETGDCVAESTRETPPTVRGQSVKIGSLPGAEIVKVEDGVYRVRHDFAKCDLSAFPGSQNVAIRDKSLSFDQPAKEGAALCFRNAWRLPLELRLGVFDFGTNTLILQLSSQTGEKLTANFYGPRSRAGFTASWHRGMTQPQTLFEKRNIDRQSFKTAFRLPVPNEPIEERFWLVIGVQGIAPMTVKSVTVSGRLSPLFGIGFDVRGETVFVPKVVAKSPAESAGVREGDVVLSINGEPPKSVKEAMSLLGKVAFGETATLVIRRAGVEKTIAVKCD